MFYDRLLEEQNFLSKKMTYLEEKLKTLPEGRLIAVRNGNYTKWYESNGSNPIYIEKKYRPFAKALAYRKFLSAELSASQKQKALIDKCLFKYSRIKNPAPRMLEASSPYRELLNGQVTRDPDDLKKWEEAPYERDPSALEECVYQTSKGGRVRSKSELLIANILYYSKIPFRYEAALLLGPSVFYPTFTLRHPASGNFYYWEHLDFLDQPQYCHAIYSRFGIYALHHILPGTNLIVTATREGSSLSSATIYRKIQTFFPDKFSFLSPMNLEQLLGASE